MKVLKQLIIAGLLLLTVMPAVCAQGSDGNNITGTWVSPNGDRSIEIYEQDGMYYGRLVKVTGGQGAVVLDHFVFEKEKNKWTGRLEVPGHKKSFKTWITLPDDSTLHVKLKTGLVRRRSIEWTRMAS